MTNIGKQVIIRTQNAGVFAGTLTSQTDTTVELAGARRLWYWSGAASLSEMAMKGVKRPKDCKFPVAVETITLSQWIEILPMTEAAWKSISEVPEWQA